MAHSPLQDAAASLRNPASVEAQIVALRCLKNETIGHVEKKIELFALGIADILTQTIRTSTKAKGKKRPAPEKADGMTAQSVAHQWSDEDEVRYQAIILVDVLLHGGSAFVVPLLRASLLPALVETLSPRDSSPKIVLASLKALVAISQGAALACPVTRWPTSAEPLLSNTSIHALKDILAQRTSTSLVQRQVMLVCKLLTWACFTDNQRDVILSKGIVDLLAARLAASCVLSDRFWLPGANSSALNALPPPPTSSMLPWILSAISSAIGTSKYRMARFLYSPIVISVFPFQVTDSSDFTNSHNTSQLPNEPINALEHSLPRLPPPHRPSENGFSKAFPALGSIQPSAKNAAFIDFAEETQYHSNEKSSATTNYESAIITWLIYLMRSRSGSCRLQAARLLTRITINGYFSRSRDRVLAVLVVPLLVGMLDEPFPVPEQGSNPSEDQEETCRIREQAPLVLAELIRTSAVLQKAAVEAGVIKKMCQILKNTFEPITIQAPIWSVDKAESASMEDESATLNFGSEGLRPEIDHILSVRESSLLLLAAIADKEDRYRKMLTESGAVPCIVDSLAPFKADVLKELNDTVRARQEKFHPGQLGNYEPVLIAACIAARAMSRSVNLLRTSLIDCGLAKPIVGLLKYSDVQVLIAATNVVCNLVAEFSPMRPILIDAGAMKILCDHAHSADSRIRLISLWALKHLVMKSPNTLKISCFEELGTGWLVQIITASTTTATPAPNPPSTRTARTSTTPSLGAANAAGERVDILNAVDEMDTDGPADTLPPPPPPPPQQQQQQQQQAPLPNDASLTAIAAQHRPHLRDIKAAEEAAQTAQAAHDEQQIVVQALDFLRNLTLPPDAPEMLDAIFHAIGAPRLFDMLAAKLSAHAPAPSGAPAPPQPQSQAAQGAADVLHAAVFNLVHVAAGAPRHRQQLMARPDVLRALAPLLGHAEPRVRLPCVLALNNLTWVDGSDERAGARGRAVELAALGLEARLRELLVDECLDVRQKAATGVEQFRDLLEGGAAGRR